MAADGPYRAARLWLTSRAASPRSLKYSAAPRGDDANPCGRPDSEFPGGIGDRLRAVRGPLALDAHVRVIAVNSF